MTSATIPESGRSTAAALGEGRRLEYLTIGWNVVEAVVSIGAGIASGSTALVGVRDPGPC